MTVSISPIKLKPHPGADNLEIAICGGTQYVVQKDRYVDGQWLISVPEKYVLPENIAAKYREYLAGKEKNRVKAITLRKQMSEGILLIPEDYGIDPDNPPEDLANYLGIEKYEPPIPPELAGEVERMQFTGYVRHDCEQLLIAAEEVDAEVVITEKLHGTQINMLFTYIPDTENGSVLGRVEVTSKGLGDKGLVFKTNDNNANNFYLRAFKSENMLEVVNTVYEGWFVGTVQLVGEALPCQKKYTYGLKRPSIFLFRLIENGKDVPMSQWSSALYNKKVPVLGTTKVHASSEESLRCFVELMTELANQQPSSIDPNTVKEGAVALFDTSYFEPLKLVSEKYQKKTSGEEFS